MSVLIDNLGNILNGFKVTLALFAAGAVCTILLGVVLGVMRTVPVVGFRVFSAIYVGIFRNVPVVLVYFVVTLCLPMVGLRMPFFAYAVIALTLYESSFVCEAVRSGLNFVDRGQSEAARSIGMSGVQMLTVIILPQALRHTLPAIANYMISLNKATSIAGVFGVAEATIQLKYLADENPSDIFVIFLGIGSGYMLINFAIAASLHFYERKWRTA